MKQIWSLSVSVAVVAVIGVAVAIGVYLVGEWSTPEPGAGYRVIAHDPAASGKGIDVASQYFTDRGATCLRGRSVSTRDIDAEVLLELQAAAVAAGGPGNWVQQQGVKGRQAVGWIGDAESAMLAFRASPLAVEGELWITALDEDAEPYAAQLIEIALPNGWSLWYVADSVRPVACP